MWFNDNRNAECALLGSSATRAVTGYRSTGINLLIKVFLFFIIIALSFTILVNRAYAMSLSAVKLSPHSDTQVKLDWSSVPTAQAYRLLRRTDPDPAVSPDIVVDTITVLNQLDSLSYTDTNLTPDTTYYYTIEAYSSDAVFDSGTKLDMTTATVTTSSMITPYNLQAVYNINTKEVTMSWIASMYADACTIKRYTDTGSPTSFPADDTTHTVIDERGLAESDMGKEIRYTVTSARGAMTSEESIPVTVRPIAVPELKAVPADGSIHIFSETKNTDFSKFTLVRSKWNGTSWGSWENVTSDFTSGRYNDTLPEGGQYRYMLVARSGYSGYSNVTEYLNALGAPTNLSAKVMSPTSIWVSWTNAPGNTGSIKVFRSVGSGSFSEIATLSADKTVYVDDITVVPGTVYTYRIMAYESSENYSQSATVSVSETLPAAPTSLRADVSSSAGILLSWTDNSNNEACFVVERMTSPGQYQAVADVLANPGTSSRVTHLDDKDLVAGNTYIYRVYAVNALGKSPYSNEVTVSSWDSVAPVSLTVTPVSPNRIDLSWNYTGTGEYNTIIERKTGATGTWATIYTTPRGALKYSDTGLSANTQYFYRIRKSLGSNAMGIPYPNDEIGKGAYTLMNTPSLSGQAVSDNMIYLSWTGADYGDVIIERKMPNGNFTILTSVSPSTTGWYDNTGLVPGASYTYRIKTQTSMNESLYSNECTVRNFYLKSPSELTATVDNDETITLNWKDNSDGESGFEIWRYTYGSGEYTLYAIVDPNVTTYTDTKVSKEVQYSYKVRAYIAGEDIYSTYSNIASSGIGLINPPSDLTYTYISKSQVKLMWKDNSDNESGFRIERKIGSEGTWAVLYWASRNSTSYTVSNLKPEEEYYFRVRAYSYSKNADSVSEEILVSTALPEAPSNVVAQSVTATQVKITWKDNSDNEKGFRILRRPSTSSTYVPVATVSSNTTFYYDNTVLYGKQYYYKVAAYNDTGSSESPSVAVKTAAAKAKFLDLGEVTWAKDAIETLAGMGVIKGVTETTFAPNRTISKAEFTVIVVRAFGFNTAPIGSISDVKPNKWYYKDLMIAENLGVISADSNGKFYPDNAITREEICMILFKAIEAAEKKFTIHDNSVLEKFIDKNNISPAAVSSMATLAGEGVIEGLPGNVIGPKYTATRAQAAVFLYRTLNRIDAVEDNE